MSKDKDGILCSCENSLCAHAPGGCKRHAVVNWFGRLLAGGKCDICFDIVKDQENHT